MQRQSAMGEHASEILLHKKFEMQIRRILAQPGLVLAVRTQKLPHLYLVPMKRTM